MFGLADPVISAAYILNILAVIISVVYGAINWNKGGEPLAGDGALDRKWQKEEKEIEKEFE